MMTWMTRMSLFDSAQDLELDQLVVAHKESYALFMELVYGEPDETIVVNGEIGAPAPLRFMWEGYEVALAGLSVAYAAQLVALGVNAVQTSLTLAETVKELRRNEDAPFEMPPWIQDIDVLTSHRSNLLRRWPESYSWPRTPRLMPYLWPVCDDDGGYVLKLSKYDKGLLASGERALPASILERISQ